MTEEAQKAVVLRAVDAAMLIRRDGHRYPECITVDDIITVCPEIVISELEKALLELEREKLVVFRPTINRRTIYSNG